MAKPAWGAKRSCQSCGARFYDMRRHPIVCPKCQAVYDPDLALKARRGRATPPDKAAAPKPARVPAVVEDPDVAEVDPELAEELADAGADEEEEEEDLIEDASELGEDDDVSKVIEKEEGEEER